ncbi:FAST kinase domain-containing protein 3, mitochondrial-like [Phlebotomus argentipes]|uniref:FAST kinase domain-containing protein 3, mitochondrial-like n=1 Tax=Phlebotomus argentipes TaxID=94469 RepID=UPI00289307FF|nr:FAST kinase domain-containing protein 3, mitochondrial-like [Phlebotomus argentipes]
MSRCIINQLRYLNVVRRCSVMTIGSASRGVSSSSTRDDKTGSMRHTTILVQQGASIQELPVIVRRAGRREFVAYCSNTVPPKRQEESVQEIQVQTPPMEVLSSIERCLTCNGVLALMNNLPAEDFSPDICAFALEKLFRTETVFTLRNVEQSRVFLRLVGRLLERGDTQLILSVMERLKNLLDLSQTIEAFSNELLMRNTDNHLSVEEICEAIELCVSCGQREAAEKFWTGLAERSREIDVQNLARVYRIAPMLKVTHRLLISLLDRRIGECWSGLQAPAVVAILASLQKCQSPPFRTMQSLSRWLSTNIHAIDEALLEAIVASLTHLQYTDGQLERSLERYVKARGVKIQRQTLIVALLNFCAAFRIRNFHILNGCSEYFVMNASLVEPKHLRAIVAPFGQLNYQPINGMRFWQALEAMMERNFGRMAPGDVISIALSCVYLEMFPLNFVKRIFNPYFLDVMHQASRQEIVAHHRMQLKLFDTAMALECAEYDGPWLPRDHAARSIWQDGRIKRMLNQISQHLENIAGGYDRYSTCVCLAQLPLTELHVIDVLLHPAGLGGAWKLRPRSERNIHTAVLVHLPEHFNSTGECLSGAQSMRIRHFRKMGLKVVTLNYDTLSRLKIHPKELNAYLVERMKNSLPAFPA